MKPSYTVPESPQSLSPVNSYNVWPGGAFPLNKAGGRRRTRKGRNANRKGRNANSNRKKASRKCGSWRR